MSAVQLNAIISHKIQHTETIFHYTLMAPGVAAQAKPGQFVMIKTNEEALDPLLRRPFSIHQVTQDGSIKILFKVVGRGTKILSQAQIGESWNILGPFGKGFPIEGNNNICIIGGGMGTAPLVFLAQQIKNIRKDINHSCKVFIGAGNKQELICEPEFRKLGFDVESATDDGSEGHHGLVTELLAQHLEERKEGTTVYTCGPMPMMKAVSQLCRKHQAECYVSLENMMACGMGACLGCAVSAANEISYMHVCKDGPVFNSGEIKW